MTKEEINHLIGQMRTARADLDYPDEVDNTRIQVLLEVAADQLQEFLDLYG